MKTAQLRESFDVHVTDVRTGDKVSCRYVYGPGSCIVELVRESDGHVLLTVQDYEAIGLAECWANQLCEVSP